MIGGHFDDCSIAGHTTNLSLSGDIGKSMLLQMVTKVSGDTSPIPVPPKVRRSATTGIGSVRFSKHQGSAPHESPGAQAMEGSNGLLLKTVLFGLKVNYWIHVLLPNADPLGELERKATTDGTAHVPDFPEDSWRLWSFRCGFSVTSVHTETSKVQSIPLLNRSEAYAPRALSSQRNPHRKLGKLVPASCRLQSARV